MWEVSPLNVVQGTSTMLITLDDMGSEPNLIGWVGTCIVHPNDHPYGKSCLNLNLSSGQSCLNLNLTS